MLPELAHMQQTDEVIIDCLNNSHRIADHIKFVNFILKRYFTNILGRNLADWDDAFSAGCVGLWKGLRSYNGQVQLSYYLSVCIKNHIYIYLRNRNKQRRVLNATDCETNIYKSLFAVETIDHSLDDDEINLIRELPKYLSEDEKQILRYLSLGYSESKMALILKRKRSTVQKCIRNIRSIAIGMPNRKLFV